MTPIMIAPRVSVPTTQPLALRRPTVGRPTGTRPTGARATGEQSAAKRPPLKRPSARQPVVLDRPWSRGCGTSVDKRINGVTIGTHRLGISLWITPGRTGENMWLPQWPQSAVPRPAQPAMGSCTVPVDSKTTAGLRQRSSSPVSTVPMTTTFLISIKQTAVKPRAAQEHLAPCGAAHHHAASNGGAPNRGAPHSSAPNNTARCANLEPQTQLPRVRYGCRACGYRCRAAGTGGAAQVLPRRA